MAKDLDSTLSKIQDKLDEVLSGTHKIDKEVALQQAAFIEHTKQDEKMYDELKRMNDILESNVDSLREHMQQTKLLKDEVFKMDARLLPIEQERIKAEAVRQYRKDMLVKIAKILGIIATVAGILVSIKSIS